MKKIIRVVVFIIVAVVAGGFLISFLNELPEELLVAVAIPLVGVTLGLLIGLPLQAIFTRRNQSHEQPDSGSET